MSHRRLKLLVAGLALASPWALAGGLPTFPGLLTIPIPKQYGYGGYFAQHQPVKIVFASVIRAGSSMKR